MTNQEKTPPVANDEVSQNIQQASKSPFVHLMFEGHGRMTLNAAGITVAGVLVAFLIGYFLDRRFETSPLFTIIAVILGFPLTQVLIYKRFSGIIRDLGAQSSKKD